MTSEWRDIASAPRDGASILTVGGTAGDRVSETRWLSPGPYVSVEYGGYYQGDGWYWSGWDGAVGPIEPKYWMPLPPPPEESK